MSDSTAPSATQPPTTVRPEAGMRGVLLDTSVAHPARRYDYWLGGKDNFAADRESAQRIMAVHPNVVTGARENRAFLGRAVEFLAADVGIRQFLDIGTGLPAVNNVHEVAQRFADDSRIVYVDNDPIVLAHARALLTSKADGHVAYLDADLRDPAAILAATEVHAAIDISQPVALLLVAVLHFLADNDKPHQVVDTLVTALAPGSYLVLSHATADYMTADQRVGLSDLAKGDSAPFCARSRDEIAKFAAGLELIEPGLVSVARWRASATPPPDDEVACYGLVAHKPAVRGPAPRRRAARKPGPLQ